MIVNLYEKEHKNSSMKYKLFCFIFSEKVQNYIEYRLSKEWSVLRKYAYDFLKEQKQADRELKKYIFKIVEIETINKCNGTCSFCPANKNNDKRRLKIMDESIFKKIIDELESMDYAGRVNLFGNNEPLLDKRLPSFLKYAKGKLDKANICIFTNGTLLTEELYREIIDYVDTLIIDCYDDDLVLPSNIKQIDVISKENDVWYEKTQIHKRLKNEVLYTRAGQAPNNDKKKTIENICVLPFTQMEIRSDGKCSLCCNDAFGKMTMGDVNESSLSDIWFSDKYQSIRKMIYKGRGNLELCAFCDSKHTGDLY